MAEYYYKAIDGLEYSVPVDEDVRGRKKAPPLVVVMNENCTACSGSPVCMTECPVDCIHIVYAARRPLRVYVDNDVCIGCMNCFSYTNRPKTVLKGDVEASCDAVNALDLKAKDGVCPWDAIEILPFESGVTRSGEFYPQPRKLVETQAAFSR